MKAFFNSLLWKRHRTAFFASAAALILFGFAYVRSGAITELEARWQTMTRQISVMDSNLRHAHGLLEQVEQLEDVLLKIDDQLFDPAARALNTNFFYQLEQALGVRVLQARQGSYSAGATASRYATVEFVLMLEGDFNAIIGFLHKLQATNAFIAPNQWEIQPATRRGAATGTSLYNLGLSVKVLARKTP